MRLRKLQFNYFFITLTVGLLLFGRGPSAFSQEKDLPNAPERAQENQENLRREAQNIEDHEEKDLEKLLDNYHQDQEKVLEDFSKLNESYDGNTVEFEGNSPRVLDGNQGAHEQKIHEAVEKNGEEAPFGKVNKDASKKGKKDDAAAISAELDKVLEGFRGYSDFELKTFLTKNFKGSKVGELADSYPRVINAVVKLLKDKDAIPKAAKVLEDKKKLVWFGSMMLCSIIFSVFIRRVFYDSKSSFLRTIVGFIGHMIFMFAVRIGIVVYFFGDDLGPAFNIIVQEVLKKS